MLCHLFGKAQIKKGSILLGGSISYISSKTTNPSQNHDGNTYGYFNLSIGSVYKENTAYGINLSYGGSISHYIINGNNYSGHKIRSYGIGAFHRQYRFLAKDFYFYTEAGISINTNQLTDSDSSANNLGITVRTGGTLYLTPGISYKILKRVYLELLIPNIVAINYTSSKNTFQMQTSKTNEFSFNTNLASQFPGFFAVGIRLIL